MGREIKRVALDFTWPLDKPWKGFINPHYTAITCEACDGSGYSPEAKRLKDQWYGQAPFRPEDNGSTPFTPTTPAIRACAERHIAGASDFYGRGEQAIQREARRLCDLFNQRWMHHLNADDVAALIEADRLTDFTHTWTKETGWVRREDGYIPTPEEVNLWSVSGMGHDSINQWACTSAAVKRLGYNATCSHCKGKGNVWPSAEAEAIYDKWESYEPPVGEGYQIWETVSDGSPITPVFATPEKLAQWCVKNRPWSSNSTFEQWMAFIQEGWVPSMVLAEGKLLTNEQCVAAMEG